jgi:Pvc16 N-terminal domain
VTLDLSAITDTLLDQVQSQWASAPIWAELDAAEAAAGSPLSPVPAFNPTFTGLAPDLLPKEAGPQLSMYLYHIEADNPREQLFWQPQMLSSLAGPGEPVRYLPTALKLYYLMSAYSAADYHQEQMLMSVAVRVFHSSPVIHGATGSTPWELTLTMENRSYDEMSRLWQATTSALRLSVVYRAAVVFLDPDAMPAANKDTSSVNFIVENADGQLPPQSSSAGAVASPPSPPPPPQEFGTFRQVNYTGPSREAVTYTQAPASASPGQQVWLMGANLDTAVIQLESESGVVTDISGWVDAAGSTPTRVVLDVPSHTSSPPGAVPAAGRYSVSIAGTRVPLTIAPQVDPAPGPVLTGSPFTITGQGFAPGGTEVLVGTTRIPAGLVTVNPAGTMITFPFTAPADVAPGTVLPISVRVAGIEADPALWVRA